jgi:hypothetical protein
VGINMENELRFYRHFFLRVYDSRGEPYCLYILKSWGTRIYIVMYMDIGPGETGPIAIFYITK